ncbi:lysophospholipid acyltransferase family protein [Micromonospora sp. CA-240977]|uniref:lysophospholipid acyltransferase family protein n=1 Tax=Micromonospora sp. CA-240977 TaxID=3239957 RepID=UPI003D8B58AE
MLNEALRPIVSPVARALYRPLIEGAENVPRRGPVILAANHLSFAENWLIPVATPRSVRYLVKIEYLRTPSLGGRMAGWFFSELGFVGVQRGGPRDATSSSLEAAMGVLRAGRAFAIYPEGTRSLDGRLYRGKTGVARLTLATGAPVVPIGVIGTDVMQPVGVRVPRRRPVTVRFGTPMTFDEYRDSEDPADWRTVTDKIMLAISELSGQEYVDEYQQKR